eukprot:SAG31_NODE_28263_length_412_cov_2.900958_1_plen_80_part_10
MHNHTSRNNGAIFVSCRRSHLARTKQLNYNDDETSLMLAGIKLRLLRSRKGHSSFPHSPRGGNGGIHSPIPLEGIAPPSH